MIQPFYVSIFFSPEGYRKVLITEIYASDQVRRFRIAGRNRSVILEKNVTKGKNNWKIIEGQMGEEKVWAVARAIDNKLKAK